MSDATQIIECEKSPTGQHSWWSTAWAHNDATTPGMRVYCIYCGETMQKPYGVTVFAENEADYDDTHTR